MAEGTFKVDYTIDFTRMPIGAFTHVDAELDPKVSRPKLTKCEVIKCPKCDRAGVVVKGICRHVMLYQKIKEGCVMPEAADAAMGEGR